MRKFIRASAFVSELLMKLKLSVCYAAALVGAIAMFCSADAGAQTVNVKIPFVRLDSVFNATSGAYIRRRIDTIWFGTHVNATNCSDTNLSNFGTHWTLDDTVGVTEFEQPPASPAGDFRFTKPKSTAPFSCYPQNGLQFDIRSFTDTTQRDTFKILSTWDLGDPAETHRLAFTWPPVLSQYFDSCIFVGPSLQAVAPLIFIDMNRKLSYRQPTDPDTGQVNLFNLLFVGPKVPPPIPATVTLTFPPNSATDQLLSLTLTWASAPSAIFYRVQVAKDTNFTPASLIANDSLGAGTTSKSLVGLSDATTYYWRVAVATSTGFSYYQRPPYRFTTLTLKLPPPVLVSPPNNAQNIPTSTTLRWRSQASLGATNYHVQLRTDTNSAASIVVNDSTLTDTLRAVTVQNCLTYFWRARTKNSAGWGNFGGYFKFRAALAPPGTPVPVAPANGATNVVISPTLSWQSDVCTDSILVQLTTDTVFGAFTVNRKFAGTSTVVGPLLQNTNYFWRLKSFNASDSSPAVGWSQFKTRLDPPGTPALLSPPDNDSTQSITPTFVWTKVPYTDTYRLQVYKDPGFTQTIYDDSTLTDTSQQIVAGLFNCTKYYWRVRAKNAAGTSSFATARNFKTQKAFPGAPVLLSPANDSTGVDESTTLRWAPSSSNDLCAQYYIVSLTKDTSTNPIVLERKDSTLQTSLTVGPLNSRQKYYWQVQAGNYTAGKGTSSPWFNFTITPLTTPKPPNLRSPANGQDGLSFRPTLAWDSSSRASSYRLQVALDSNFALLLVNDSTILQSSAPGKQVGPLPLNNHAYYWRVNAKNSVGTSDFTPFWSFRTLAPPSAPTLISPANGETSVPVSPVFVWTIPQRADSYRLQVARDSTFIVIVKDDSDIVDTSWPLGVQLDGYQKYYWRVFAKNSVGYGDTSVTFTFMTARSGRPNWTIPISVCETGPACDTVYFSITAGATYGIDAGSGELELPPPTPGWFDLRFIDNRIPSEIGEGLRVNRHPFRYYTQIDTFKLRFQPGIGTFPMIVSWDKDSIGKVCDSMVIKDEYTGTIVHQDMRTASFVATNLSSLLIIEYGAFPTVLGVKPPVGQLPKGFTLSQNYPNPFNPSTRIDFTTGKSASIRIAVYDLLGREISVLASETFPAGFYYAEWDGRNGDGQQMPSGVYYVRMIGRSISEDGTPFSLVRKVVMMK